MNSVPRRRQGVIIQVGLLTPARLLSAELPAVHAIERFQEYVEYKKKEEGSCKDGRRPKRYHVNKYSIH